MFRTTHIQQFLAMVLSIVLVVVLTFTTEHATAQVAGEKAKLSHVILFDGSKFDPSVVAGKPTLIYFWASWCPTCRREMRTLEKYYQAYKEQGFNIIAINFRDKPEKAIAMLDSIKPISYAVGTMNDEWLNEYPKVYATPTWMLVDKKGILRKVITGKEVISGGWFDGLESDLKKVIAENN